VVGDGSTESFLAGGGGGEGSTSSFTGGGAGVGGWVTGGGGTGVVGDGSTGSFMPGGGGEGDGEKTACRSAQPATLTAMRRMQPVSSRAHTRRFLSSDSMSVVAEGAGLIPPAAGRSGLCLARPQLARQWSLRAMRASLSSRRPEWILMASRGFFVSLVRRGVNLPNAVSFPV
jgi:hypothetical protein